MTHFTFFQGNFSDVEIIACTNKKIYFDFKWLVLFLFSSIYSILSAM